MLEEDFSAFFIPLLESSRKQAAAVVGLTCCKLLVDGQGPGALSEVQPVFVPPTICRATTRSSNRLAAAQNGRQGGRSTLINN